MNLAEAYLISSTVILLLQANNSFSLFPWLISSLKIKIILKMLAHILARIMPTITSKEHRGFIHGRPIKDCICLTSEAINLNFPQ
jgi:hypothetical protein